jgi:hypothetical protein
MMLRRTNRPNPSDVGQFAPMAVLPGRRAVHSNADVRPTVAAQMSASGGFRSFAGACVDGEVAP